MNLDGTHTIARKGGESVVYQYRKRAKTSNILPISEAKGFIIANTGIIAGNRHDAFNLKANLQRAFKKMKRLGIPILEAYFNADSAFDTRETRKVCFNHGMINGNFEMDYDDGEMRYKTSIDVEGTDLTSALIRHGWLYLDTHRDSYRAVHGTDEYRFWLASF